MNTTRSEAVDWPHDERSDQVHAQQQAEREQIQTDIEQAWERLISDFDYLSDLTNCTKYANQDDIKLLKWALGVK